MPKLKNLPEHLRPREKLLDRGAQSLSDKELLALVLGRGTARHDVLSLSEKLIPIIDEKGGALTLADLTKVPGIGRAGAAKLVAAFEFARRRIKPRGLKIQRPQEILPLIRHYGDRQQEHFLSVSLNGANEVMAVRVVTIGLVNKSQVHPREVFSDLIAERAAGLIAAHNHPSGDLSPSTEDREVTRRLKEAGTLLGIPLMDHIIFHGSDFYSFAAHNLL
ncbi:MAG: DNA repair protein RadC [Desulfobacter sp.]|nr:MAG: DNA repair protein RadC [Desulfobacter sp.]